MTEVQGTKSLCEACVAGAQGGFCRNRALPGEQYCEVHADAKPSLFTDVDQWLVGLEDTFASPNRECSHEDTDEQGNREGNACIEAEMGDLEFPDDWCERCYVLYVTRQARASLRGEVTA